MQKPSIGRIVHLCFSGLRVPAVITWIFSEQCVNVRAFNGTNEEHTSCLFAEESPESAAMLNNMTTPHLSWSWPPRV